jgi:magnesium chelatase subunit D
MEARLFLAGRRGPKRATLRSGRHIRSAAVGRGEHGFAIAVDATLRRAAQRRALGARPAAAPVAVRSEDLQKKVRERARNTLVIFVVDASDSMGTEERMAAAKGAALALLTRAYQRRDRVGLVAFRDEAAEVLLRPTTSVSLARDSLRRLPTGGATPFADGLWKAWQLARIERLRDPEIQPLLVIISDGEANVPLERGREPAEELRSLAQALRGDRMRAVAIDTTEPAARSQPMLRLAESLGAAYHRVRQLQVRQVVEAVRAAGRP